MKADTLQLTFLECLENRQAKALLGQTHEKETVMKTNIGFRYLFIVALAALAIQACAKKDGALRAKAAAGAANKTAADKATASGTQTDPKLVLKDNCPVIKASDGAADVVVQFSEFVTGGKEQWVLTKTNSYVSYLSDDGKQKGSIEMMGSPVETPDPVKETALNDKATVLCQTMSATTSASQPYTADSSVLPNSISATDGKIAAIRMDHFTITPDAITAQTKVSPVTSDIKSWGESLKSDAKKEVTVIKHDDKTISLRIVQQEKVQSTDPKTKKDSNVTYTRTFFADYAMKDATPASDTSGKVPAVVDPAAAAGSSTGADSGTGTGTGGDAAALSKTEQGADSTAKTAKDAADQDAAAAAATEKADKAAAANAAAADADARAARTNKEDR
jgi:hypothetical protein